MNLLNIKDRRLEAYYAYLTLLPIEYLLKQREAYRTNSQSEEADNLK